MRKIKNRFGGIGGIGGIKRNPFKTLNTTVECSLINRYRVILTFFMIGCLTTFLIAGVRDVYGAGGCSLSTSPTSVNFGRTYVGQTSGEQKIALINNGGSQLKIVSIPKGAPPDRPWASLSRNDCSSLTTLPAGASCDLYYVFQPYTVGDFNTPINIQYTCDSRNVKNANVLLRGTGAATTALAVDPATGTYGGTVNLSATLTALGSGVSNKTITFTLNGNSVGSATTIASGVATLSGVSLGAINAGSYPSGVKASFAGDTYYDPSSNTGSITIDKATPTVSAWPTASGITYGQALSASTLTGGTASVQGSFAFTTPSTTPNAGTTYSASVTFTPTDTNNYNNVTGSVNVAVAKATPIITWANPADIVYGTKLSSTQLNATATYQGNTVGGSFAYSPAADTVLNAGPNQSLTANFTPTDTTNYNPATKTVVINVGKAKATVTLSDLTQTYTGSALTPTATTEPAGKAIEWTNAPRTNAGSYEVTATVKDDNYEGSASGTFTINKALATITLNNLYQKYDGTPKFVTATTDPSGLTVVTIKYKAYKEPETETAPTYAAKYEVVASLTNDNYEGSATGTLVIDLVPTTSKRSEKVLDFEICTELPDESGCPTLVYSCDDPGKTPWVRSTFSQIAAEYGHIIWIGGGSDPVCPTVDIVTESSPCVRRCYPSGSCVVGPPGCTGTAASGTSMMVAAVEETPPEFLVPITTFRQEQIGGVMVCTDSPDESGCPTHVYSCDDPTQAWQTVSFSDIKVDEGHLQWVGIGSDPVCPTVDIVTGSTTCVKKCYPSGSCVVGPPGCT